MSLIFSLCYGFRAYSKGVVIGCRWQSFGTESYKDIIRFNEWNYLYLSMPTHFFETLWFFIPKVISIRSIVGIET